MTGRIGKGRWPRAATVVAAGVLVAALAGTPASGASAGPDTWAQNGGTFGHAGVNAGERALGPATVGRLSPSWTLTTGSVHNIPGTTTARVVSGTAYVVGDDDTVYAMNSHTGALRWSTGVTGTTPFQQPLVQDGVLVEPGDLADLDRISDRPLVVPRCRA
jgi:outer membrane protein assembly factor BamB